MDSSAPVAKNWAKARFCLKSGSEKGEETARGLISSQYQRNLHYASMRKTCIMVI